VDIENTPEDDEPYEKINLRWFIAQHHGDSHFYLGVGSQIPDVGEVLACCHDYHECGETDIAGATVIRILDEASVKMLDRFCEIYQDDEDEMLVVAKYVDLAIRYGYTTRHALEEYDQKRKASGTILNLPADLSAEIEPFVRDCVQFGEEMYLKTWHTHLESLGPKIEWPKVCESAYSC
jgi:hypothetical protein